jgi:hypothetical protein
MTAHKKLFPWPAIGVTVTVIVLLSGIISSFAVNGEKVKRIEEEQRNIKIELSFNSTEHKKIIETLGTIDKTVARMDERLSYLPVSRRYSRDTTR